MQLGRTARVGLSVTGFHGIRALPSASFLNSRVLRLNVQFSRSYARPRPRQPQSFPKALEDHFMRFVSPQGRRVFIWGVIGVNAAVCIGWATTRPSTRDTYDQVAAKSQRERMLIDNWTLSQRNLHEGRGWTLLTCAFSHYNFFHLLFNMVIFDTAASAAFGLGLGPARILTLATGATLASSAGSIWDERTRAVPVGGTYLGASGMVEGLLTAVAMVLPRMPVYIFFIPVPVPLWLATAGFLAWDTYSLSRQREDVGSRSRVGHAAHLSGAAFGALYYLLRLRTTFGRRYCGFLAPR